MNIKRVIALYRLKRLTQLRDTALTTKNVLIEWNVLHEMGGHISIKPGSKLKVTLKGGYSFTSKSHLEGGKECAKWIWRHKVRLILDHVPMKSQKR